MSFIISVIIGFLCLIVLILFRVIKTFRSLLICGLMAAFVILALHRLLPQSFSIPKYFDSTTIDSIAEAITDFSFVKVKNAKDGNKSIFFKIGKEWVDVHDIDKVVKHGSKYEISFDGITSTDLTKEQVKILKQLFNPLGGN